MLHIILAVLIQVSAGTGLIPARLVTATAPVSPHNIVAGTCVLADVPVDARGRIGEIKILQGLGPFNDSATRAIKQWKFSPATLNGKSAASRVGVFTVFRPPALGNTGVGGPSFDYKEPRPSNNNHPPLPLTFTDPGYPQSATTEGVVIIEVTIDKTGSPSNLRIVQDVPQLSYVARGAILFWKFMPAMEAGQPVNGTLVVAMSFVRPLVINQ